MKRFIALRYRDIIKNKHLKGVTLVEILVTAVIGTLIITALFAVMQAGDASWRPDMGLLDLFQEARQAMDGMVREIRQSNPGVVNITLAGTKVTFYLANISNPISYYRSGNQIIREHPQGTTKILANDISALNFSLSGEAFKIQIGAAKTVGRRNISFPLTEKVWLRNE